MPLILLLITGVGGLFLLRMYFAALRAVAGFILIIVLALLLTFCSSPSRPLNASPAALPSERVAEKSVDECDDVGLFTIDPVGLGKLCDRYYKAQQCIDRIESAFESAGRQLRPVDLCGSQVASPAIHPFPEPLENAAIRFLESVPDSDRAQRFAALHTTAAGGQETLTLDEVRSTPDLEVFMAFAKPSSDALQTLTSSQRTLRFGELKGVPMFEPFIGIVRGVYVQDLRQECRTRLRDHSLCLQRDGVVKCNIFDQSQASGEQVCVDYLIR